MTSKTLSMHSVAYIFVHQILLSFGAYSNGAMVHITSIIYVDTNSSPCHNNFLLHFRLELLQAREKHKEEQVMALKHSMQSGMVGFLLDCFCGNLTSGYSFLVARFFVTLSCHNLQAQAMKEQAQLREEMAYQYKLGNFEVRVT